MKKLAVLLALLLCIAPLAGAEMTFVDATDYGDASEPEADAGGFTLADEAPEPGEEAVFSDVPADSTPTAPPADEGWPRTIVVTVGGDTTLGSVEAHREREDGFDKLVAAKGYAWPFSGLKALFASDDLTLVNFEGTLTESDDKADKKYNFKGPAEYAQMLVEGSVEAVTLANNHTGDYGDTGRQDTKDALDAYGIAYCGPNEPIVYEVRGVKIGLIGNTFPYKDGKRDISQDVKALRDSGCQIVIASFHWGSEYAFDFTRDQRNIGRAAIKSGADVVIGHHPHVIQGIELYEDTYILYSLGNLVFGGNIDPDHRDAYVAQLSFTVAENGDVTGPEMALVPILLTAETKGTDFRPVLAEGDDYDRILGSILKRSSNMGDFENPR